MMLLGAHFGLLDQMTTSDKSFLEVFVVFPQTVDGTL
jgi:hypothetical protein